MSHLCIIQYIAFEFLTDKHFQENYHKNVDPSRPDPCFKDHWANYHDKIRIAMIMTIMIKITITIIIIMIITIFIITITTITIMMI